MAAGDVVLRFDEVSFNYGHNHPILDEADFSVRRGSKVTIMGQNGAGKSTIFSLITGALKPESGSISTGRGLTIAISRQVIPRGELDLTVRDFFLKCFTEKVYDIDPRIDLALEAVNFHAPKDRIVRSFSGGQQARLLLASALIQHPDILLLDEPTNNLDKAGIEHLTAFLKGYDRTVIVISHDADFLNSFTDGVLYLDVHTKKVEQYVGDYKDVLADITARIEKENRANALLAKEIQAKKDQANMFANKGGQMRLVAKRMREKAEELEEEIVEVRKEDKTIRPFTIPSQPEFVGPIIEISSYKVIKNHKATKRTCSIKLKRKQHLLLKGPNGIGKSTLLETLASGASEGAKISEGVRVGYYRQDFSTLNFEDTVYESLLSASATHIEQHIRATAAGFLIHGDMMDTKIGALSEGQKGLVAFARLVLQKPGLLILDEPTNHINFRHIPVIAEALDRYEGAMILVSHVPEFVEKIRIDEVLDLEK
ncbi:MAG: ABC-F family ATP-binding cassette domain-containing protein [Candidatus Taylorbacteria bacterium]|nr:ABC-F family ATP-binding cassette domain-containing protein [Candidatus Taylorbacteria bacterium]